MGSATDTEREEREWQASEVALRLAAIVESSDDAIVAQAPDGTITSWNPAAERLYGYAAEEAVGQHVSIIEPTELPGETSHILRRVIGGERVDHYETHRLAKDGRRVDVSLTVSPIRAPDGAIVGASVIARDIGERRRAEQYRETLLRLTGVLAAESTLDEAGPRLLEAIASSMGWEVGGLWLVNDGGDALELCSRWRLPALHSFAAEEAAPVTRFAPGEGLPGAVWRSGKPTWIQDVSRAPGFPLSEVVAGEEVRGAIALPVWTGDQVLGVLEFFSPSVGAPDAKLSDLLRAVGAQVGSFAQRARAVRRLSEAKADAVRANQAKSEFLSRMSHELRTPLNAILGFAQLLEFDDLQPKQREDVGQILKAGRHLLGLIDEVLDIARIEAGELALSVEPVAASELVEEAVALVAPLADRRAIRIAIDPGDGGAGWVLADRQRLKQVLLNLLSNAIKYNRERGRVDVSFEPRADRRLAILVTDTGPGISPEYCERLFMPFERLGAETGSIEGTGLGLALSKRLVEAMDGTLQVSSEPGHGTTMSIELPRAARHEATDHGESRAQPQPAALTGRTLLYIEDNLANLRLVESALDRMADVRLLPAMQGKLGLELAREHRPDLVLLDLHLPDLPGHEVLLRLKAEPALRDTRVIVVSADATERQQKRMLAAGAYAYLAKPIDIGEFVALVADCLAT